MCSTCESKRGVSKACMPSYSRTYLKNIELLEIASYNCMQGLITRRAVGNGFENIFLRGTPRRSPRTKTGTDARGTASGAVDLEHRRAVPHPAAELPELHDGASTLSVAAGALVVARRAHETGQRAARGRRDRRERELHRRDICLGHGRWGARIGKTRRGKGVKIMVIVDRHGMPLTVSTHAANHHEVTRVRLSFDF